MARPVCTITIQDEVFSRIVGLTKPELQLLYDQFSAFTANYFFNPRYKIGQWDGKVHFVRLDGITYTYMLEDILPYVIKFGYAIKLVDQRIPLDPPTAIDQDIFAFAIHPETEEPIQLRDYQVNAVNAILEEGQGLILAATSAGKTLICAAICYAYGRDGGQTLTIVPNQDLIAQTKEDYVMCKLDVGEYSGTTKTLDHQHIISTWQALQHNPTLIHQYKVVLVDECHGVKGPQLRELLVDHGRHVPHRIGVTGTLPQDEADALLIHAALGPTRFSITASELIERGVLARPTIKVIQLEEPLQEPYQAYVSSMDGFMKPVDYKTFKSEYFPDYASERDYLIRQKERLSWIADYLVSVRDANPEHNTLCLASSIPVARKIAALIPGAIVVNGQDVKDPKKRKEIYKLFKTQTGLMVIATVHIAGTGTNIPRIHHLAFVDIGKSFIRVIQTIGRGLRKAKGKDSVLISDICSDLKYSKQHLGSRKTYYNSAHYPFKVSRTSYADVTEIK